MPYSAGLQQLLRACYECGLEFDIHYNGKKRNIFIDKSKEDQNWAIPEFSLKVCTPIKYLGHYMSDDLSDDIVWSETKLNSDCFQDLRAKKFFSLKPLNDSLAGFHLLGST